MTEDLLEGNLTYFYIPTSLSERSEDQPFDRREEGCREVGESLLRNDDRRELF